MQEKEKSLIERGYVKYSDFGAVGDGITNDHTAIYNAHVFANEHGLDVFADKGAIYYIHTFEKSAPIKTHTDLSGAKFIIDDRGIEKGSGTGGKIFYVAPDTEKETVIDREEKKKIIVLRVTALKC